MCVCVCMCACARACVLVHTNSWIGRGYRYRGISKLINLVTLSLKENNDIYKIMSYLE